MTNSQLTVEVKCSYNTVAETDNQFLCAQILGLIAADQRENPKTGEQILREKLEEERDEAKSSLYTVNYTKDRLAKELKELQEKVGSLAE